MFEHVKTPDGGQKIVLDENRILKVPDNPIISFIEGDGTGVDVIPVARQVVDAAVLKAYAGKRQIFWQEVFAGQKAEAVYGAGNSLPQETLDVLKEFIFSIKGPLGTLSSSDDVQKRSLNVALRQSLDLYACIRPVRYFQGAPSPLKEPEKVDIVVFRESSEDVYAGIEWAAESAGAKKVIGFLTDEMGVNNLRFPNTSAIGIKPVSIEGTKRLVRKAIKYAIANDRPSVTIVHKATIMKCTEGGFRDWAYELAKEEFGAVELDGGPWMTIKNPKTGGQIIIKDNIADDFWQHILLRSTEHSVVATLNLVGDYIADALAAQVGGVGIAAGANIGDGIACFEVTHGPKYKYAGKNYVNPSAAILSGELMLRYMGWTEAADLIIKGMDGAISAKRVTYDFARMLEGATQVSSTGFGQAVIERM